MLISNGFRFLGQKRLFLQHQTFCRASVIAIELKRGTGHKTSNTLTDVGLNAE